jgi:hypothetical protein
MRVKFGEPLRFEGEGGKARCQAFTEKVMQAVFELK